ncbi:cache domain-containing protein, partial [Oceanospirillum sp. HFRX-1_2]
MTLKKERASYDDLKINELRHLNQSVVSIFDVYDRRIKAGIISQEQAQKEVMDLVEQMRFGESDYFWIMDYEGVTIMHHDPNELGKGVSNTTDINGKYFLKTVPRDLVESGESVAEYYWQRANSSEPSPKISHILAYKPWKWAIVTGVYVDDIEEAFWKQAYSIISFSLLIMCMIALIAFAIARSITRPLKTTVSAMEDISRGEGDLTARLKVEGNDEITQLTYYFNGFVERIHKVIIEASRASEAVSAAAEELSSITTESSATISQQAKETDQVATAIHEMSTTVHEVAQNAGRAAGAANNADQEAIQGKQQVETAIRAIHDLTGQVKSSADVIQTLRSDSENIGTVLDVIR